MTILVNQFKSESDTDTRLIHGEALLSASVTPISVLLYRREYKKGDG